MSVDTGFIRYEDFSREPSGILQKLCLMLKLPYDSSYVDRWQQYTSLTGDKSRAATSPIKITKRHAPPSTLLSQLERSEDYQQSLHLLGYKHPAP